MKEVITRILNEASTAPSPDNFQPWRFEVRGSAIHVYKIPQKVNHLLDHREHVLVLTIGMLIENIFIAASKEGYRCKESLFPDGEQNELVAIIHLEKETVSHPSVLANYLRMRCTNRRPYSKTRIPEEVTSALKALLREFPGMELQLVTDQKPIRQLGKAVSAIDQIMCENRQLHQELFRHITWTIQEEQETHQGLSLDALELNPGEKLLFRTIKNWPVMSTLNAIGFGKVIRSQNARQYGSSACSAVISMKNDSTADYLSAGRFVERFWLTATRYNLSLHPIVGVIYCYQKVANEAPGLFSEQHANLLKENYMVLDRIAREHGKTDSHIVFFFRMGFAKPSSYRSTRRKAEIEFKES